MGLVVVAAAHMHVHAHSLHSLASIHLELSIERNLGAINSRRRSSHFALPQRPRARAPLAACASARLNRAATNPTLECKCKHIRFVRLRPQLYIVVGGLFSFLKKIRIQSFLRYAISIGPAAPVAPACCHQCAGASEAGHATATAVFGRISNTEYTPRIFFKKTPLEKGNQCAGASTAGHGARGRRRPAPLPV